MQRSAFSLIELSIVLVILGLLVGGILGGQSLIRAAELRSVTTDYNKFQTALNAFRDKYNALPGDMPNATHYWTAVNPTPATCQTTPSPGAATCDGNGDGHIAEDALYHGYESFRFWQHLSNAGLMEGQFTGVAGSSGGLHSVPGTNVPGSKISGAGFSLYFLGSASADANYYDGNYKHAFHFGGVFNPTVTVAPIITPADAYGIDAKLDDGKPATGNIVSFKTTSVNPGCSTSDAAAADYAVGNTGNMCSMILKTGL